MKLPEHIGCKNTDNCISELMAAYMAEELLPPGQNAIFFANALASISTYRSIRDGTVKTERKLTRRTLTGCEKSIGSRLMRNIAHYSTKTLHMTSSSSVLNHNPPYPQSPYKYHNNSKTNYENEEENESKTSKKEEDSPYREDYAETISANLEQRRLQKPEEITHDTTPPCAMGPINKEEQHTKMKVAQKTLKKWVSYEKGKQHSEEAHDNHPFRPILHVQSDQLERGTRVPTGRLNKFTPNRTGQS